MVIFLTFNEFASLITELVKSGHPWESHYNVSADRLWIKITSGKLKLEFFTPLIRNMSYGDYSDLMDKLWRAIPDEEERLMRFQQWATAWRTR